MGQNTETAATVTIEQMVQGHLQQVMLNAIFGEDDDVTSIDDRNSFTEEQYAKIGPFDFGARVAAKLSEDFSLDDAEDALIYQGAVEEVAGELLAELAAVAAPIAEPLVLVVPYVGFAVVPTAEKDAFAAAYAQHGANAYTLEEARANIVAKIAH